MRRFKWFLVVNCLQAPYTRRRGLSPKDGRVPAAVIGRAAAVGEAAAGGARFESAVGRQGHRVRPSLTQILAAPGVHCSFILRVLDFTFCKLWVSYRHSQ